ncbi:hypothetical protein O6H91_23G021000 [Diphasiastrum complanatum]|uniref:Uncharacterized protein n=1 Tax=Diphasiastrum complanatum TaxID=34168 RepID=A0ACC2A8X0_DIPCM|nr:hypothetical protein O6H91_23G021000 [Diphasiastrum complanatum]
MFILVSLARGEIVKLKVPTSKASGGGLFFENKVLRRISFCIAVPLLAIVVGKYYLEKEGVERKVIWGLGQDKKLHQYRLPDSLQAWTGSDGMPLLAHFHIPAHSKPGCAIVLCEKTSVLLTGAEDGVLQLRKMVLDPLHAPVKVRDIQMYDGYNGGITCVTVAGRRIFTAGANGVLFSCPAMEAAVLEDDLRHGTSFFPTKDSFVVDRTKHCTKTENEESHTLSILEKYEENAEARSSLAIQACQTQMRNQIQKIRAEFVELFEKNRKAPDLEQLSSLELIVDLELEAQLRMDGQKRIHHARQQVRLENVKKEILAERIKHECWDKMSEAGSHLWPFIQGCEVSNFPKHEDCARHIRLAKVAKILRIVAIQESMWLKTIKLVVAGQADNVLNIPTAPGSSRSSIPDVPANEGALTRNLEDSVTHDLASPGSVGVEPGSMKLDDNLVSRRSSAIITRESSGDKSGSDQDNVTRGSSKVGLESTSPLPTPEEDQEETDVITPEMQENGPVENLLYHSFDLISSKKKRMQRLLLQIHLVEIRDRFNLKLEETRSSKRDIMERIKEMNARIRELQRLLGQKDEFTLPIFDHIENPNSIFEVKDEEIAFPKPVTEEDRLEELRRLEEENLRIQQGGNGPERALQDMMGGKLEQKEEEVVIETQLEKPTWMSGNPKNFTKEQLKEIKEFEGKIKAQKEEKEKKVRAQEAEQRKLKSDIQDLMTMFDKSVMDLYNMRLMEEVECNEIEEKIARLSNEIEEEEALDEQKEEDLAKRLELLKVAKGRSVSTLTEFKREVDDFREHYDEAIAEDKALDRNFKKDFADCGDLVALLYKHFRRRRPSTPKLLKVGSPF